MFYLSGMSTDTSQLYLSCVEAFKEARKGFLFLQCLWNDERLQRRIFNGWTNYMSLCNSIAGLYFEGTCDVILVTMAMHKVHKNVHSILVFVN